MSSADAPRPQPQPTDGPPRPSPGGKHVPTLVGLLIALTAVAVYLIFFLRPESPSGPPVVARLTSVEGGVRVKPAGAGSWTKGQPSRPLSAGDVVQTDHRSGAEITFLSGNVVRVRPDSVVLISEGEAAVAEDATAWHVQSGQVNFELKKDTDIVTSTARTRATANSAGNVNVTDEGGTGVKIFRGSAQVATKEGQTVNLVENQAVLVDPRGKAGPTIVLPPPPTLVSPPPRTALRYVAPPEPTAQLQWEAVRGGETYRVVMDYNVQQANLLLSAALDQPGIAGTAHALRGLDPGSYFWRVAGVTREGIEGDFSRVSFFSVVTPSPEPPSSAGAPDLTVVATAVTEGILQVKGRTERGAAVTVDGHDVKVLLDGSFSEFVKRPDKGFVVVRATGPNGQFTEQKRTVAAN